VIETRIEGLLRRPAGLERRRVVSHRLHRFLKGGVNKGWANAGRGGTHDVHITELVQPKVVRRVGGGHKVPHGEGRVDLDRGDVELVQDPFLDEALFACGLFVERSSMILIEKKIHKPDLGRRLWHELLVQLQHGKLCRVKDLVAELSIPLHPQNLQIYITSYPKQIKLPSQKKR
jgi:hypothetical protein